MPHPKGATHAYLTPEQTEVAVAFETQVEELIDRLIRSYGSQSKCAKAIGFSTATLGLWRRGERRPPTGTLAAILHSSGLRLRLVVEDLDSEASPRSTAPPPQEVRSILADTEALVLRLRRALGD